jgi:peptidoglycan hydrolase CwlO-like protein
MTRKHHIQFAVSAVMLLGLVLPASAQVEINPDHYEEQDSKMASISPAALQAQIKDLQSRLQGYEAQLKAKSGRVEEARQEAISAGIQGDGAGSYIDACRQEQKELEQLQKSLSAKIEEAQNTINGLRAQLTLVATKADLPQPRHHRRQNARTQVVAQGTMH